MRRFFSFAAGLLTGSLVGIGLVLLFTPTSGEELRRQIQEYVNTLKEEAQRAAAERRAALEAELARLRGDLPMS